MVDFMQLGNLGEKRSKNTLEHMMSIEYSESEGLLWMSSLFESIMTQISLACHEWRSPTECNPHELPDHSQNSCNRKI